MDDLSIDELLEAVSHAKAKPTPSTQGYQPVEYIESPATIYCLTCQTQYDGLMTRVRDMDNPYDNYQTKWCPNCINGQEKLWWEHCFRMRNITTKSIEK
jgi:hypothetical protein